MWMELDGGAPALMFHFGVLLYDVQLTVWGDMHVTHEIEKNNLRCVLLIHVLSPEDVCFTMPQGVQYSRFMGFLMHACRDDRVLRNTRHSYHTVCQCSCPHR